MFQMIAVRASLWLFMLAAPVLAQTSAAPTARSTASAPPAVIACASLANLRMVLRKAKDDPGAVPALIKDPKADLGCNLLDRAAVTGLTDHVTLNGQAYDCLALQHTSICHWVVAGAVTPPEPAAAPSRGVPAGTGTPKPRR